MITLEQLLLRRRVLAVSRKRHRPRTLPVATPPRAAILQHTALLHGISRELDAAVADELAAMGLGPVRTDAADGDAGTPRGLGSLAARLDRLVAKILQRKQFVVALDGVAANVAGHTREQFQRQVTAALGVDLPNSDPDFHRVFRDFRAKNTALIKTMAEDKVSRVRRVLREAGAGTRVEDVAERLRAETGITERHAALVARDQVLKLNGQVTEQRHREAGVTEYVWRTSRDERVREEHRALDGTRHKYTEPPVQNRKGERANPGQFFQCRCVAEPILPDFDEDFAPGQRYAHGTASPVVWSPNAKLTSGRAPAKPAPDLAAQLAEHRVNPPERRPAPDEGTDGPVTVRHPGPSTDRPIPAPMTVAHPERSHVIAEALPAPDLSVRVEPVSAPDEEGTPPRFNAFEPAKFRDAAAAPVAVPQPSRPESPAPEHQKALRAQAREIFQEMGFPPRPTHAAHRRPATRGNFDVYEVHHRADMGNTMGSLLPDGRMIMRHDKHLDMLAYADRIAAGTTAAAPRKEESAMATFIHESLHEHSTVVGKGYDGIGHDIEEGMTELVSRRIMRERFRASSPNVQRPDEASTGAIAYDVEILHIRDILLDVLSGHAAANGLSAPTKTDVMDRLERAALDYKVNAAPLLPTESDVVQHLLRQFPWPDDQADQTVEQAAHAALLAAGRAQARP